MRCLPLFLALGSCWLAAPALADALTISSLAPALAANQKPAAHVVVTEPPFEAVMALRNDSDQPLRLTLAATPLVRVDNGRICGGRSDAYCGAIWELSKGEAWTALPEVIDLPSHGRLRVRLSGTVNATGAYRSELTADYVGATAAAAPATTAGDASKPNPGSAGAPPAGATVVQSSVVEVQRDAGTLPADLWVTPAAPWGVDVLPFSSVSTRLQADLQNTSGRPLRLRAPAVVSQTRTRGQNDVASVSLAPSLNAESCGKSDGALSLQPDQRCSVGVTLPSLDAPGRYAVTLQDSGVGGGAVPVTLQLNVRNPWWCAALPILLGVLGGWVVRNWRASGRDLYLQLADLADLVQESDRLAGRATDETIRNLLRRVRRQVIDLRDRLRDGRPVTGLPDYALLRSRLDCIEALLDIDLIYVRLPPTDTDAVVTQRSAAVDAIATDGQTAQAMQQAVRAYHNAVDQAQKLARLRQDSRAFFDNTAPSLTIASSQLLPDGVRQAAAAVDATRAPLTTALEAREIAAADSRLTEARRGFARLLRAVVDDCQLAWPRPGYVPEPDWNQWRAELRRDAPSRDQIDAAEGPTLDACATALAEASLRHLRALAAAFRHEIETNPALAGSRQQLLHVLVGMPSGHAIGDVLPALRVLHNAMLRYDEAVRAGAGGPAPGAAMAPAQTIPDAPAAAAAPISPLPEVFPLLFPADASRSAILRAVAGLEWITLVLGLLLIVVGGLQSLWVGQPSWGAPADWLTAILWGGLLFIALDGIARPAQRG
jgi:hypothetical protein